MAASSETLARRLAGLLSGNVEFSTHGIGRTQLLDSLEARGKFVLARADIEGLNLKEESPTATSDGGRFSLIQAGVTLGARRNRFAEFAFCRCDRKLSRFRTNRFFPASQFGLASGHSSLGCQVRDDKSFHDLRRRRVSRATDSSYWTPRSAARFDHGAASSGIAIRFTGITTFAAIIRSRKFHELRIENLASRARRE